MMHPQSRLQIHIYETAWVRTSVEENYSICCDSYHTIEQKTVTTTEYNHN